MSNEANTCRKYVEPKLRDAGWEKEPHDYTEQYYFTNGKIRPKNKRQPRGERKFTDYLLLYNGEFPLAVVEAKRKHKTPDEGLEQAIDYANLLGVKHCILIFLLLSDKSTITQCQKCSFHQKKQQN